MQPDGRALLRAARPAASVAGFVGLLAGRSRVVARIEDTHTAAADGWAGKV